MCFLENDKLKKLENNVHELWAKDKTLFERMKGNYVSNNEANFFKNIQHKQEHEITALNDLLISEYENPDEIYLVRMYYEEYLLGYKMAVMENLRNM